MEKAGAGEKIRIGCVKEGGEEMLRYIMEQFRWKAWRREWRRRNQHNFCEIQFKFNMDHVHIGRKTYGMINAHIYKNDAEQLYIGSFCSIAENVHFVFGEHDYKRFCMYPFNGYILNQKEINPTKGAIVVEDDVWIGMNCTILSGVTIHRGAVIGAGAVVTHDVPPYAVYAGNRVVKYRFPQPVIEKLMKIDFDLLTDEIIQQNQKALYTQVTDDFFETALYRAICAKS